MTKQTKGIQFTKEKMEKFRKQDALLSFLVKDLIAQGHEEIYAMEVTFNGYILGDSVMEAIYNKL